MTKKYGVKMEFITSLNSYQNLFQSGQSSKLRTTFYVELESKWSYSVDPSKQHICYPGTENT